MGKKIWYSLGIIALLFICGGMSVYLGFAKGNENAINISRPGGAVSWTTPGELVNACTYTPIVIGVALLLLSLIFSTVLFIKWLKD